MSCGDFPGSASCGTRAIVRLLLPGQAQANHHGVMVAHLRGKLAVDVNDIDFSFFRQGRTHEDMIQRLGIRRRHPVADDLIQEYRELETGDEPIRDLSKWLDHKIFIKFHLFCRRSEEVQRWSALGEQFSQPHAREMLLRYIPPKRWRPFFSLDSRSAHRSLRLLGPAGA
mgnify:CR=1 FL=1